MLFSPPFPLLGSSLLSHTLFFLFFAVSSALKMCVCVFGLCATPRFVFIKRNTNIFSIRMSSMCCMMLYIAYRSVYIVYFLGCLTLQSSNFSLRLFLPFCLPRFVGFFSGRIQPKVVERGSRLESTFMRPRQRATWTQNTRSSNSSREEAAGRKAAGRRQQDEAAVKY